MCHWYAPLLSSFSSTMSLPPAKAFRGGVAPGPFQAAVLYPVTYALPLVSTAMPEPMSAPPAPRKVCHWYTPLAFSFSTTMSAEPPAAFTGCAPPGPFQVRVLYPVT